MSDDTAALTIDEFCRAYRVCRETCYREVRAGRLLAKKLGRKTLVLKSDAEAWAAALPELRTGARQASA
jgi:excisionase family DNA binding protein